MKLFSTLLLTFFSLTVFAQSNYHEGYVLKNNGDTLKGFVNYRDWNESPRSIDFKKDKNDKQAVQFDPKTIKEFKITGLETYITYTGKISADKTHFPDLPDGLDTTKKQDTIFLKQLVTGNHLTLLQHRDEFRTRFFIAEKNGAPVELTYHEYYNDSKQVIKSNIFKGQLLLYVNKFIPGNSKVIAGIEQSAYEQTDLESIVEKINDNGTAGKRKSSNRLFAGIGINSTSTQVNDINTQPAIVITHTTISPKINLGIDVFVNPNVQQFIFRGELSFSYINPRLFYPVTVNSETTANVYSFNQYTATVTPQLLFNVYNKDNCKVYIDGGAALNFSAYTNNKFSLSPTNTNSGTIQIPKPYVLKSSWISFPVQAGVALNKKIEFSFTYVPYASYTNYSSFFASNRSMCLGVKYLFGSR